jgi:hypothetical protein
MNRAKSLGLAGLMTLGLLAIPTVAFAQTTEPSYCNLVTPTVRDVVQDAPAIAAVLNLDPALPDQTIIDQRNQIGCGELPAQTEDQARGELCAVLKVSRVEGLVDELNDPNATRGLESVRPALGLIIDQSRDQLNCDVAGTTTTTKPAPTTTPEDSGADNTDDDTAVVTDKNGNQVVVTPRGSANTGDGSYTV